MAIQLNSIYQKYSAIDYWGYEGQNAGVERSGFDWLVNKTREMIEAADTAQLIERIRYDQKVMIEIYQVLTGDNLKGKSNKQLAVYFNGKYAIKTTATKLINIPC